MFAVISLSDWKRNFESKGWADQVSGTVYQLNGPTGSTPLSNPLQLSVIDAHLGWMINDQWRKTHWGTFGSVQHASCLSHVKCNNWIASQQQHRNIAADRWPVSPTWSCSIRTLSQSIHNQDQLQLQLTMNAFTSITLRLWLRLRLWVWDPDWPSI